jgi:hypothetical protein
VLVAYIIGFRIIHYFLFYTASKPFLVKVEPASEVKGGKGYKAVEMV